MLDDDFTPNNPPWLAASREPLATAAPRHFSQTGPAQTGPAQTTTAPADPEQTAVLPAHAPAAQQPSDTQHPGTQHPAAEPAPWRMPAQTPPAAPAGGLQNWDTPRSAPSTPAVSELNLLRRAKRPPQTGWRRAVYALSGRMVNPGESPADIAHRELVDRSNQPIRGDYRIALLSLKGGVGKTTTTVGLGSTFASIRGDRVIAVDANPDLGTLGQRIPSQTTSTARSLLEDRNIRRYSDVRAHTSQAPSRLEVLASEKDPAVSEAFSESNYRSVLRILQSYYNIILTDCGTGLMHSAMAGVLDTSNALVLITSPAIDGARSAVATLDWLEHHGYAGLVERTVVVVNSARRGSSSVDLDQLERLFLGRCRAVQVVPYDSHLAEGAEIDLELVSKSTRRAFLELAATVAEGFGMPR